MNVRSDVPFTFLGLSPCGYAAICPQYRQRHRGCSMQWLAFFGSIKWKVQECKVLKQHCVFGRPLAICVMPVRS